MKNLITTRTTSGATTTITKSFNSKTQSGLDIVVSVWRSIICVTEKPHETKNYFSVSYKGVDYGHHKMNKDALNYYIGFIDKWSEKL